MENPRICVNHRGRLGNKMFQAMFALELARKVPNSRIFGLDIPEWGLHSPPAEKSGGNLLLRGQSCNLNEIVWLLNSGAIGGVTLEMWGQRLNYFGKPERYRNLFKPYAKHTQVTDNQILINIRAEDIVDGWHPLYLPMPFSYYRSIIDHTGLEPVFMGQLDDSDYVAALKSEFKNGIFLPSNGIMEDFETMRNARNIVLSISTFSWLAAWLSDTAKTIHLPVAGLFNPLHSPTMLLPIDDSRYQFYRIRFPEQRGRTTSNILQWAKEPQEIVKLKKEHISNIIVKATLLHGQKARPSVGSRY